MTARSELTAEKETFADQGFVRLKGVFDAPRLNEMKSMLDAFLEGGGWPEDHSALKRNDDGEVVQINGLNRHSDEFTDLMNDDVLTGLAGALLGREVEPAWVHYRNAPCRTNDQVFPHQDAQGLNLDPCEAVTFWMPFGPCGPTSGCLRYVPGSHRAGFQGIPYGPFSVSRVAGREKAQEVVAGDILAHHCLTIHRSAPNFTDRRRPALMFFFKAADARAIDADAWMAKFAAAAPQPALARG